MLRNITYYPILGKPLIMYLGIITLLALLFAAYIAFMNMKGKSKIPLKWHFIVAKIAIILAIIHAALGVLAYL